MPELQTLEGRTIKPNGYQLESVAEPIVTGPGLPREVQKFIDTTRQRGQEVIYLRLEEIQRIETSRSSDSLNKFNRRFKREQPEILDPHNPNIRIVRSFLMPEAQADLFTEADFILQPNAFARDSTHGVFFGILRSSANNGKPSQDTEIAVKPYIGKDPLSAYSDAWREFVYSHLVSGRGMPTIRPLGIVFDDEYAYMLTACEKLTSLSEIVWTPLQLRMHNLTTVQSIFDFASDYRRMMDASNETITPERQILKPYLQILGKLSIALADLHSRGIFPQDSQIKNFVSEVYTDQVWGIDWENVIFTFRSSEQEKVKDERIVRENKAAFYGLTQLFLSLVIPRVEYERKNVVGGITGIGLFDPLIKNALKQLERENSPLFEQLKEINSSGDYSVLKPPSMELDSFVGKINKLLIHLFDLLILYPYRQRYMESCPQGRPITSFDEQLRAKMHQHLMTILPIYLDIYTS